MGRDAVVTAVVEPLRDSLLHQRNEEIARLLADTAEEVAAKRAEVEQEGLALVEQARADGIAAAGIAGAHDEVRARRRVRSLVLTTKRELYDELRRQALEAAQALRQDPRYPALLERLSAAARAQLGDAAVLEVDPPNRGGVRASSGARHVDYTLDALVERCLDRLGGSLEQLWA
jgi:vacuolar-type H+-ATPase subunit E/Vma4